MPVDERLDSFLEKLDRVRRSGGSFRADCPVHGGRSPGDLSIRAGARGILLHCFAGCSNEAILDRLGLDWKDLFFDTDGPVKARRVDRRAVELESFACAVRLQNEPEVLQRLRFGRGWAAKALELLDVGWDGKRLTLPVRDATGKLHDVLRYDPFLRTGRKVLAGRGKSRLPWPAPEGLDTHVLFLVEGEGTAISMLSVGLYAVSLPGSIAKPTFNTQRPGSWQGAGWHRKWAERFSKFHSLVLLPDCDGNGRALMGAARYDLERAGVRAAIVDLGPKTHDGSDVADMLLSTTCDRESRLAARNTLREIVAEQVEVLVA